jgi:hypothetical protein
LLKVVARTARPARICDERRRIKQANESTQLAARARIHDQQARDIDPQASFVRPNGFPVLTPFVRVQRLHDGGLRRLQVSLELNQVSEKLAIFSDDGAPGRFGACDDRGTSFTLGL